MSRQSLTTRVGLVAVVAMMPVAAFVATGPWRDSIRMQHETLSQLQSEAALNPNDTLVQYYLALRARQARRYDVALAAFAVACESETGRLPWWIDWAQTAEEAGKPDTAIGILKTFDKYNPGSAGLHTALARAYLGDNRPDLSALEATRARTINRGLFDAWLVQGEADEQTKSFEEARSAFKQAVALSPNDWRALEALGRLELQRRNYPVALGLLRQASDLAPKDAAVNAQLGSALYQTAGSSADMGLAKTRLELAAAKPASLAAEDLYTTYLQIGQICELQCLWKEALSWLKRASTVRSDDSAVHYELARVYRQLGDAVGSERELKAHEAVYAVRMEATELTEHLEVAPADVGARLKLARLCASHGMYTDAVKNYRTVLEQSPGLYAADRELKLLLAQHQAPEN